MQITIRSAQYRLQLVLGHRPSLDSPQMRRVVGEHELRSLLRPDALEEHALRRLRRFLRDAEAGFDEQLGDTLLARRVVHEVSRGRMDLWVEYAPLRRTVLTTVPEAEAFEPLVSEPEPELSYVTFQVLEREGGAPVSGIPLLVTLPDGSQSEHRTDDDGLVDIRDVPEGVCSLRSERNGKHRGQSVVFTGFGYFVPSNLRAVAGWSRAVIDGLHPSGELPTEEQASALVRVVQHRVAAGQTLESIAEEHGVSVDDITEYNWGTTDPAAVSAALATDVGCRRRNPDTGAFEFSDDDDPGIIAVPLPFECTGRATDTRHIIQVERPRPRPRWVFSL